MPDGSSLLDLIRRKLRFRYGATGSTIPCSQCLGQASKGSRVIEKQSKVHWTLILHALKFTVIGPRSVNPSGSSTLLAAMFA